MIKQLLVAAAAIAALTAAANAENKAYNVPEFEAVSVAAGLDATITVGEPFSVIAEGSEKALARLEVKVKNGELQLRRVNKGFGWSGGGDVDIRISMPDLKALDVSSGAHASARGVDAREFRMEASSGAHAEAEGVCGALNIDASSGAHADARDLKCERVEGDASSGAQVSAFASKDFTGDASSGGNIKVYGSPERVSKETSSGGSISIRDAD